jgi:hypothetical protein
MSKPLTESFPGKIGTCREDGEESTNHQNAPWPSTRPPTVPATPTRSRDLGLQILCKKIDSYALNRSSSLS